MRKNLKKIDYFTVLRIRFYKFVLRHYRTMLRYSYRLLLVVVLIYTILIILRDVRTGTKAGVVIGSAGYFILSLTALTNFLIAFTFALYRERQLSSLKNMVVIDELTQLYNKRYFLSRLHNEIVRSRRYNHIVSLIVIDIDHFKKLNDTYGHICGDFMLRAIAKILKAQVRMVDAVCRFGGEEFVVICPETGAHEAKTIAERIRKQIEAYTFSFHEKTINVTISAGVNHFDPLKPKTEGSLFSGADKALYVAKNCGRNRVVIFSSLPSEVTASLREVKRKDKRQLPPKKKPSKDTAEEKQLSL
ncbi:MAG: GGDEF domain-containing protein [Candidatus Omnitrophica bacterium]|nr:GGDEF domain-containing protein [Candidatus Omnitrophota bacterium]